MGVRTGPPIWSSAAVLRRARLPKNPFFSLLSSRSVLTIDAVSPPTTCTDDLSSATDADRPRLNLLKRPEDKLRVWLRSCSGTSFVDVRERPALCGSNCCCCCCCCCSCCCCSCCCACPCAPNCSCGPGGPCCPSWPGCPDSWNKVGHRTAEIGGIPVLLRR